MEDNWYNDLIECIDEQEDTHHHIDDLEIMLVLVECGYSKTKVDIILKRGKALGFTKEEIISKIKEKL